MSGTAQKVKTTYSQVASCVEQPFADRKSFPTARGNSAKPRRYHLPLETVSKIKEASTKFGYSFYNPFNRKSGIYYSCVQSLGVLSPDVWHPISDVKRTIIEIMSSIEKRGKNGGKTVWDDFKNKERKSKGQEDKGKVENDELSRIIQNYHVLQRLTGRHLYGGPLAQFGQCIDIRWDPENIEQTGTLKQFRLRTNFDYATDMPLNLCKKKNTGKAPQKDSFLLKIISESKAILNKKPLGENQEGIQSVETTEVVIPQEVTEEIVDENFVVAKNDEVSEFLSGEVVSEGIVLDAEMSETDAFVSDIEVVSESTDDSVVEVSVESEKKVVASTPVKKKAPSKKKVPAKKVSKK